MTEDEGMVEAFEVVQESQRAVVRLLMLYVVEDDIRGFYEAILDSRGEILNLITSLTCTIESYIRYEAYRKGITVQEEIQSMALGHERFTLEEALEHLRELEEGD